MRNVLRSRARPAGSSLTTILVVATALFAAPRLAFACTGVDRGTPPCQAAWEADAVFTGTVVSAKGSVRRVGMFERVFTVSVDRVYTGTIGSGPVEVDTGLGGGDCGYEFVIGRRYVVYAKVHADTRVMVASMCTRTAEVGGAQPTSPT